MCWGRHTRLPLVEIRMSGVEGWDTDLVAHDFHTLELILILDGVSKSLDVSC